MKTILYYYLASAVFILIFMASQQMPHLKEYNKHICAVYGAQEDCKTPLEGQN